MKYSIDLRQNKNGEWKVRTKANVPYYEQVAFDRRVKEALEENGFTLFKLIGVDE